MGAIRKSFYKMIFKVGFVKRWYIGNELLKNPATVSVDNNSIVSNVTFINVTLKTGHSKHS